MMGLAIKEHLSNVQHSPTRPEIDSIEKNRVSNGQTLIPNELDLNFGFQSVVQSFIKIDIKIDIKIENCERGRGDRHTDTQTRVNLLSAPC